jgi:hypothetical protein
MAWGSAGAFLPAKERSADFGQFLKAFLDPRSNEPILRLVKDDAPISGQIKTEDGLPAAGTRIELSSLWTNDKGDLSPWLSAVGRDEVFTQATWGDEKQNRHLTGPGLARFAATTDADGRFRLAGIGRGRLVALRVWGPNVEGVSVLARTAPGEKVGVKGLSKALHPNPQGCFGPEIALTVAPSRPIEGVVKDADTGKPVAGAVVESQMFARLNFMPAHFVPARTTDAAGRFRLEGMPVGRDNLLLVRFTGDQPYLAAVVMVDTRGGKGSVKLEVPVRRGVWVEGQVTDAKTGRPLVATIDVFCPLSNPQRARYASYQMILPGQLHRTNNAGRFRVPAIPGRAVVAAQLVGTGPEMGKESTTQAGRSYRPLRGLKKIDGLPTENYSNFFGDVAPSLLFWDKYHQLRSLDIPADAESVQCDLKVE